MGWCSTNQSFDQNAKRFDLHYYDELVRQTEVIRFTIGEMLWSQGFKLDRSCAEPGSHASDPDCDPPLELVIGTKWKNPSVNWNGAEVLL